MTLEEIKQEIVNVIDNAWHALVGTVDVDAARAVVAGATAELTSHVSAVTQHLFDHVLGNAAVPAAADALASADQIAVAAQTGMTQAHVDATSDLAGLATGGIVSGPGPAHVGETGPETLALPQDAVAAEPEATA